MPSGGSECIDVGTEIDVSPFQLLGGHVLGGAYGGVFRSEPGLGGVFFLEEGEAEIGDFDVWDAIGIVGIIAAIEKKIGGFDIAVNDSRLVSVFECEGGLADEFPSGAFGERAVIADDVFEIAAGDELHGEEEATGVFSEIVGGDDVRMLQASDGAGFLREAGRDGGVSETMDEDCLQGDGAVEAELAGFIDDSHAATSERAEEFVAGDDIARVEKGLDDVEFDGFEEGLAADEFSGRDSTLFRFC